MITKFKAFVCRTGCLSLLSIVFLSGCFMIPSKPEFRYPERQSFKGIAQHLESLDKLNGNQKSEVDIILFHGMGIHKEAWLDPAIIQTLLPEWKESKENKRCFVVKENSNEDAFDPVKCLEPNDHKETDDNPKIDPKIDIKIETISFTRERGGRDQEIRLHSVIWSGLTTPFKRKLCSDIHELREDARAKLGCERDQKYRHFRSIINSKVKSGAINSGFSDVVIYLGKTGEKMRKAFRSSISHILQKNDPNASLAIITSSLASYIIAESVVEKKRRPAGRARRTTLFHGNQADPTKYFHGRQSNSTAGISEREIIEKW